MLQSYLWWTAQRIAKWPEECSRKCKCKFSSSILSVRSLESDHWTKRGYWTLRNQLLSPSCNPWLEELVMAEHRATHTWRCDRKRRTQSSLWDDRISQRARKTSRNYPTLVTGCCNNSIHAMCETQNQGSRQRKRHSWNSPRSYHASKAHWQFSNWI